MGIAWRRFCSVTTRLASSGQGGWGAAPQGARDEGSASLRSSR